MTNLLSEMKLKTSGNQGNFDHEYSLMTPAKLKELLNRYEKNGVRVPEPSMIKTKEQIDGIRESGKVNTAILDFLASRIQPGMTTKEIDDLAREETYRLGGIPAPLGYNGYEKSICTSLDEIACHGIPDASVTLKEGSILNVDVSTIYNGYYSDSSRMFLVGQVDAKKRRLVRVAYETMLRGIGQVRPFARFGDMASCIWRYARSQGYEICPRIGGHGVGLEFHEKPFVPFVGRSGSGMLMVPGMVFTIEPIVNMGDSAAVLDEKNGWTFYTTDGLPSAQWEVTVAVTTKGHEILAW